MDKTEILDETHLIFLFPTPFSVPYCRNVSTSNRW